MGAVDFAGPEIDHPTVFSSDYVLTLATSTGPTLYSTYRSIPPVMFSSFWFARWGYKSTRLLLMYSAYDVSLTGDPPTHTNYKVLSILIESISCQCHVSLMSMDFQNLWLCDREYFDVGQPIIVRRCHRNCELLSLEWKQVCRHSDTSRLLLVWWMREHVL